MSDSSRRRRRRGSLLHRLLDRWGGHGDDPAARPAEDAAAAPDAEDSRRPARRGKARLGRKARVLIGVAGAAVLVVGSIAALRWARDGGREDSVWALYHHAAVLYEQGRYADAIKLYDELVEARPEDDRAAFFRAVTLMRLERDAEAWAELERIAEGDHDFDQANGLLAVRAFEEGRREDAEVLLRRVLAHPPQPSEAHSLMARILRGRGETTAALPHLREVVVDKGLDSTLRVDAALEIGLTHNARARFHPDPLREHRFEVEAYAKAREIAEDAVARGDDDRADLQAALAGALLAHGETRQALGAIEQALSLAQTDDERSGYRLLRSQIYWESGAEEESVAEVAAALQSTAAPSADAFMGAAGLYGARGHRAQALATLAAGTKAHPAHLELGLAHARELFSAGRGEEAEAECRRLAEAHPGTPRPLLQLGDLRIGLGDPEGAEAAYEEALAAHPASARSRLRLATVLLFAGDRGLPRDPAALHKPEQLAREVLQRDDGDPGALVALAQITLARRETDAAEAFAEANVLLRRALERDPSLIHAQALLAFTELQSGRAEQAAVGYEHVLRLLPNDRPQLRLLLTESYLRAGAYGPALINARAASLALPDDARALRLLSRAELAMRKTEDALVTLERLHQAEPNVPDHLLSRAYLLAQVGEVEAAEEHFAKADEVARSLEDPQRSYAEQARVAETRRVVYRMLGEEGDADAAFNTLVARNPGNPEGFIRYGKFLETLGKTKEAEGAFKQAIALAPDTAGPRRALCELWFRTAQFTPDLDAEVKATAERLKGSPDGDYILGKLRFLAGDVRVARDLLASYVGVRPEDPDGHHSYGIILSRTGAHAEAVEQLEEAQRILPRSAEIRVSIAKVRYGWAQELLRRGRVAEAQDVLRGSIEADPLALEPRRMLAAALTMGGDMQVSEKELLLTLEREPNDLSARRLLALNYARRGEGELAVRQLEKVLAQDAGDWSSWMYLARLRLAGGDPAGAERAARSAREAAPETPQSILGLVLVLTEQDRLDDVETLLQDELTIAPDEPFYRYLLAVQHVRTGRLEDAVKEALGVLERRPSMTAALTLAASVLANGLGRPAEALKLTSEHAQRVPESVATQQLLAMLLVEQGRSEDAVRVLQVLVDRDPPYFPAVMMRAQLAQADSGGAAARAVLERGLEAKPRSALMHGLVAESHIRDALGAADEATRDASFAAAIASLRQVVEIDPGHATARNNLAFLLARDESSVVEAYELVESLAQEFPENVGYLDTKGTVQIALGRADDAVATFRHALGLAEKQRRELTQRLATAATPGERAETQLRTQRLERRTSELEKHYERALEALDEQ